MYQCASENDFHLHGIFLSYIGASGGTRINTGFLAHLYISLSQARGQRTAKHLKVLPAFSKAAGFGAAPQGLGVARGGSPCLPILQKRGDVCPPLGVAQSPGEAPCLQKTYAEPAALSGNPRRGFPAKSLPLEAFSTLLRLPKATKAARRCLALCKFFEKNLTKNFYLSPPNPSAGRLPAAPRKPRRPKAACATRPVRPRTACRRCACRCPLGG